MRRPQPDECGGGEGDAYHYGELGIGVLRAQATQILSYVDGTPHAAIAKILGRGAVRRNLGRRVPAKLCVCSAMDDLRVRSGRKP